MSANTIDERVWDWTIEEMFQPLKELIEQEEIEQNVDRALGSYMFMQAMINGDFHYKHCDTRNYIVVNNGQLIKGKLEI